MIKWKDILTFVVILGGCLVLILTGATLYKTKIIDLVDQIIDVQGGILSYQNTQDTKIKELQDRMNVIFFNHGVRLGHIEDRLNTSEDRINKVEQVSKGALDLSMKDKKTVGWSYLLKGK
jgi:hypothetical protein